MIIANMIISDRDEPYLPWVLLSIEEIADFLIVNDNSGKKGNPNLEIIKQSSFYKKSKVHIVRTVFNGFGEARTICLNETARLGELYGWTGEWILNMDSDEVHLPYLQRIKRFVLPKVPKSVGYLEGYYFQMVMSYDYVYSIERRHNMLFRFIKGMRWEGEVHEQLKGGKGKRVPLPYIYFHYGYVRDVTVLREKLTWYEQLAGNIKNVRLLDERKDSFLDWQAKSLFPLTIPHPECIRGFIRQEKVRRGQDFRRMEDLMRIEQRNIFRKLAAIKRQFLFEALHTVRKGEMFARELIWSLLEILVRARLR